MPTPLPIVAGAACRSPLLCGALLVVTGELMFASMGASIRFAAQTLPNEMVVFLRNLLGISLLLPWFWYQGPASLATRVPHLHLLRGLAGLGAMYCFYYAIVHMHLGEAMLLKMTAPLFIPFVALFWLREKLSGRVLLALAIGFGGVALVISPELRQFDPVALIGLLGGALAALAKVTVRRLSRSEPAPRTVFYFALTGALVSAIPLGWAWQTPSAEALLWMLAVALFATLGQLLMTRGFAFAPAGQLSAFTYSSVVFASVFGWTLWQEVIRWSTVSGAMLVALAGVLAARVGGDRSGAIA